LAPENLPWRIEQAERRLDRLESRTEDMPVLTNEIRNLWLAIENLRKDIHESGEETRSLRRAILVGAVTFAFSALGLIFTIAQVFG
jgi:predicted RNase H-like nuclease (RuvC/YqgF family)